MMSDYEQAWYNDLYARVRDLEQRILELHPKEAPAWRRWVDKVDVDFVLETSGRTPLASVLLDMHTLAADPKYQMCIERTLSRIIAICEHQLGYRIRVDEDWPLGTPTVEEMLLHIEWRDGNIGAGIDWETLGRYAIWWLRGETETVTLRRVNDLP